MTEGIPESTSKIVLDNATQLLSNNRARGRMITGEIIMEYSNRAGFFMKGSDYKTFAPAIPVISSNKHDQSDDGQVFYVGLQYVFLWHKVCNPDQRHPKASGFRKDVCQCNHCKRSDRNIGIPSNAFCASAVFNNSKYEKPPTAFMRPRGFYL